MKTHKTIPWICVTAALLGMWGCILEEEPIPRELIGRWETPAEKFRGFSFELTKEMLIFYDTNSPRGPEINTILDIDRKQLEGRILFTIETRNEEGLEYEFALYYNPKARTITLKNQDTYTWRKRG